MLVRLPDMPSVVVDLSALPASFSLPSNASILVSLFAALGLLVLVHAAYVLLRHYLHRAKQHFEQKKVLLVAQEQGQGLLSPSSSPALSSKSEPKKIEPLRVTASALEQQTRIPAQGKWGNGLLSWFKWEKTPPVSSLSTLRNDVTKDSAVPPPTAAIRQIHVLAPPRPGPEAPQQPPSAPQLHRGQSWQQIRRAGPAFETPVPTLYQTDVPASMAKIIMSRHTYRKPTPRPPSRSPSPSSQVQISRRPPSIV